MGGSWDATNVVDAEVAVFTPISTTTSGGSGTTIADDRGGEVRDHQGGATVVLAAQHRGRRGRAARGGRRARRPGRPAGHRHRGDRAAGRRRRAAARRCAALGGVYTEVFLPLHGVHQAQNALLALVAAEALLSGGRRARAASVVGAAFADVDSPGPARGRAHQPDRPRRRRPQPGRRRGAGGCRRGGVRVQPAGRRGRGDGRQGCRGDPVRAGAGARRDRRHPGVVAARSLDPRTSPRSPARCSARTACTSPTGSTRRSTSPSGSRRAREDLGSGVLVTGSVTIVADARILLGRG